MARAFQTPTWRRRAAALASSGGRPCPRLMQLRSASAVTPSIPFFITYQDAQESYEQWSTSQTSKSPNVSINAHWVPYWQFEVMAITNVTGTIGELAVSETSSCSYVPQMPELQMLANSYFTTDELTHIKCPVGNTKFQRMEHEDEDVLPCDLTEHEATERVRSLVTERETDRMNNHFMHRGVVSSATGTWKIAVNADLEINSRLVYMPVYEVKGANFRAIVSGFDGSVLGPRLRDFKRATLVGSVLGCAIGYPCVMFFTALPLIPYTSGCAGIGALLAIACNTVGGKLHLPADDLRTASSEHERVLKEDQKVQETINSSQYAFMNFHHRGRTTKRRTRPVYSKFMEEDFGEGETEDERAWRNMNDKERERRHAEDDGSGWRTHTFGQEAPGAGPEKPHRRVKQRRVFTELYEILHVGVKSTDHEIRDAFVKISKTSHPDLFSDADEEVRKAAVADFQQVLEAFTILKDRKKRKHYDETGEYKRKVI